MKKIDLGQTINTLANIGVLVGIIFLAIEVSQNQESLDEANAINLVSARDATVRTFREFNSFIAQDEELMRIFLAGNSGDELSPVDNERYSRLCTDLIWLYAASFERMTALGMDQAATAAAGGFKSTVMDNPGMRECWETSKGPVAAWGISPFVTAVEESRQ
jgi:hypothetical protein